MNIDENYCVVVTYLLYCLFVEFICFLLDIKNRCIPICGSIPFAASKTKILIIQQHFIPPISVEPVPLVSNYASQLNKFSKNFMM